MSVAMAIAKVSVVGIIVGIVGLATGLLCLLVGYLL
jgi:hypothetical protein